MEAAALIAEARSAGSARHGGADSGTLRHGQRSSRTAQVRTAYGEDSGSRTRFLRPREDEDEEDDAEAFSGEDDDALAVDAYDAELSQQLSRTLLTPRDIHLREDLMEADKSMLVRLKGEGEFVDGAGLDGRWNRRGWWRGSPSCLIPQCSKPFSHSDPLSSPWLLLSSRRTPWAGANRDARLCFGSFAAFASRPTCCTRTLPSCAARAALALTRPGSFALLTADSMVSGGEKGR